MAIFSAAKKLEQHKKIRHRLTSDDNGDNVGEEGGDESTAGEEVASQDEKTSINSEKEETDVDDNESKNKGEIIRIMCLDRYCKSLRYSGNNNIAVIGLRP